MNGDGVLSVVVRCRGKLAGFGVVSSSPEPNRSSMGKPLSILAIPNQIGYAGYGFLTEPGEQRYLRVSHEKSSGLLSRLKIDIASDYVTICAQEAGSNLLLMHEELPSINTMSS